MSEQDLKLIFSKNLRHYMAINGVKQTNLCEWLGVGSGVASDWCNGRKIPRMDKIDIICKKLGLEWSDLMTDKSEKKEPNYYLDDTVRDLACKAQTNSAYRVLLDAVNDVKPEDIKFITEMIKLKNGEQC